MTITFSIDRTAALSATTAVSNIFITEYAKKAPAEYIRVYLYALMQLQNRTFENDDIATALELTDEQVAMAFEYWQRMGLLTVVRSDPMHIEFARARSTYAFDRDRKYSALLEKLRPILGERIFSASELRKVYDWIEIFGLDEGTIPILIKYCMDTKGSSVNIRYMDETAKGWADANITTVKDAESYVQSNTQYSAGAREVLKLFGMRRSPTEAETALYKKWVTEYRLEPDVIYSACAQTVGASNPSFGYLSRIIDSLHENGTLNMETLERERRERQIFEDFCKELFKRAGMSAKPNATQRERIETWLTEYHISKEILLFAAEKAKREARPFAYMCKAALALHDADALNKEDAVALLSAMDGNRKKAVSPAQGGYIRHNYTAADLAHIGVNFDDEEE